VSADKKYRVIVILGSTKIEGPWQFTPETAVSELATIQQAQTNKKPIHLPWLAVGSGEEVTAAYIEEKPLSYPSAGPVSTPRVRRDMQF
jgi:hypothetical protein